MLERLVNFCLEIAAAIIAICVERAIPFGFNIESVAIKKDEIEASIYMVKQVGTLLAEQGIRKQRATADYWTIPLAEL